MLLRCGAIAVFIHWWWECSRETSLTQGSRLPVDTSDVSALNGSLAWICRVLLGSWESWARFIRPDLGSSFYRSYFLPGFSMFMGSPDQTCNPDHLKFFSNTWAHCRCPSQSESPAQSSLCPDTYKRRQAHLISSSILVPLLNFLREKKKENICLSAWVSFLSRSLIKKKKKITRNINSFWKLELNIQNEEVIWLKYYFKW